MNYFVDVDTILKNYNDPLWYPLLSTDPRLTGNVKINFSQTNIFLDSIESHPFISNTKFKKFTPVSDMGYYMDLTHFISPLKKLNSPFYFFDDKHTEYYSFGYSKLESELYQENCQYFAPLYLGYINSEKLPHFFTIYKIKKNITEGIKSNPNFYLDYLKEILEYGVPIANYDLRVNTIYGNYIKSALDYNLKNAIQVVNSDIVEGKSVRIIGGNSPYMTTHNIRQFNIETVEVYGSLLNVGIPGSKITNIDRRNFLNVENLTEIEIDKIYSNTIKSLYSKLNIVNTRMLNLNYIFNDTKADDEDYYGFYSVSELDKIPYKNSAYCNNSFKVDIDSTNKILDNVIKLDTFDNLPKNQFISGTDFSTGIAFKTKQNLLKDNNNYINSVFEYTNQEFDYCVDYIVDALFDYDIDLTNIPLLIDSVEMFENIQFLCIGQTDKKQNGLYYLKDKFLNKVSRIKKFEDEIKSNFVVSVKYGHLYKNTIWEIKNETQKSYFEIGFDNIEFEIKKKKNGFYGFLDKDNRLISFKDINYLPIEKEINFYLNLENVDLYYFTGTKKNSFSSKGFVEKRIERENLAVNFLKISKGDKFTIENKNINHSGKFRWTCISTDSPEIECYKPFFFEAPHYLLSSYLNVLKYGLDNLFILEITQDILIKEAEPGQMWKITLDTNKGQIINYFLLESITIIEDKCKLTFIDINKVLTNNLDITYSVIESLIPNEYRVFFNSETLNNLKRAFDSFVNITVSSELIDNTSLLFISNNKGLNNLIFYSNFVRSKQETSNIEYNNIPAIKYLEKNFSADYVSLLQTKQNFLYPISTDFKSKFYIIKEKDDYGQILLPSGLNANWDIKFVNIKNDKTILTSYTEDFEWTSNYPLKFRLTNVSELILNKLKLYKEFECEIFPVKKTNITIKRLFYIESFEQEINGYYSIIFTDKNSKFVGNVLNGTELVVTDQILSKLKQFDVQNMKVSGLPTIEYDTITNEFNITKFKETLTYYISDPTYNILSDFDNSVSFKEWFEIYISKFVISDFKERKV